MGKGIKNYATRVAAKRTITEIEEMLVKRGASDIWKTYDNSGNPTGLNFIIRTEFGSVPFRIPVNVGGVSQVLQKQQGKGTIGISRPKAADFEYARDVAWRTWKDWIEAQLSLMESDKEVKFEQLFLPFIYDIVKKKTLYESFQDKKFEGLPRMLTEGELNNK